jgi:membrane protease YdiL (CAAX protease family)
LSDVELWLRGGLVAFAVLAYYSVVVKRVGDALARAALGALLQRSSARSYTATELDGVVRLALAGLMQLAFCFVMLAVSGVTAADLLPDAFRPMLLVYGLFVGIGEAALATHVANVGMRVAMQLPGTASPSETEEWLAMARGGWMRFYIKTVEVAPIPLVAGVTVLYISVEEIVFRGLVINAFDHGGAVIALAASVLLFTTVQLFHMPSWQSAMFAMLGALTVGIVHGLLYLAVPDLTPLIVAHVVLFLVTLV